MNVYRAVGLLKWSLVRHKFYIPVFVVVQIILSLAVMFGFSYMVDARDFQSQTYLVSGAMTLNTLAVTCVLAPQIVSEAKQNGIYDYQKSLPISKVAILLSDVAIWGMLSLPGLLVSIFVSTLVFGVSLQMSLISILSTIFVIVSLLLFGFALAYLFPANMVALLTQVIMLGALLFSPIVYTADRLPEWSAILYNHLPFVPVSQIFRFTVLGLDKVTVYPYMVVLFWGIAAFLASIFVLMRRK